MSIDTTNWSRADLVREAKLQTDAIQRLGVWLRLGYSLLAVGAIVAYWGFSSDGDALACVLGVAMLVVGALASALMRVGIVNARRNVRNILDAAGVDLEK